VVTAYRDGYEAHYKSEISTFGGHAYDGLMLLVGAIKSAGSTDKAKVRDALEATKAYVGTGGVVNMSASDHMGLDLSAFRMLEVKNGTWALVN
jgi:branched-chain amino acid transport system substrate-binding protein